MRSAGVKLAAVRMVVLAVAAVAVTASSPAVAQPRGFSDVPEDAYYSTPVMILAEQGVFVGTECEAGFCPSDPIDRKTMAVWIVRVLDGADPEAISESRFDDVDADDFYAPFIERMAELEVTQGCGDGTGFCPDRVVSRAQMAVFLTRAFGLPAGADPGFVDVAGDAWYAAAVSSLVASGITQGCGDGTGFCPQQDTNRGQMATFLARAFNLVERPSDTAASDRAASIEITPIGRGVSVTSEDQILVELEAADVVPANPFDLAGRTLVFAPDGRGGYSRAVGPLDWDSEDRGERPGRPVEIDLRHFEFDFSGRKWRSFFLSRTGLVTFGEAFPQERTPARFGTMEMIAEAMVMAPTISALYKPYLGGNVYVSDLPDRVVITYYAWDHEMAVYGGRPKETFNHQVVLHSDGRVAFNYGPDPADADEAFRDGIVGLFQTDPTTGEAPRIADRVADLSRPDSRFSAAQTEVFRYPAIRDRGEGVADVSCRIIEVLGDEFDLFAFNSQSRVDQQEHGPAHGFAGWYPGNQTATGLGQEPAPHRVTPCESRLTNSWGFPVWMKAPTVVNEGYASDGHRNPYDEGLTYFGHEIAHTWLAYASYLANGERTPMQTDPTGGSHWAFALHAPAPFSWDGAENGSVMGGAFWRDNPDGTFSPTVGWWTKAGGFSWLDLYLMGLATPEEVPDMFMLRDLQQLTSDRTGPYAGDKEIVTMDQIIAAIGPRNPPPERARKVFNVGFVYFLLPGETPDPGLLREHANYRDRALDHWHHLTGGRGQLTTELP